MELVNATPFASERTVLQDRSGRDLLIVVVKCTYRLPAGRPPMIAEEQAPIRLADDFYGEPGQSSIRYECDLAPRKTGNDVVLLGHA